MTFLIKYFFWSLKNKDYFMLFLIFIARRFIRILLLDSKKNIQQKRIKSLNMCKLKHINKNDFYKIYGIVNCYNSDSMEFCEQSKIEKKFQNNKLGGAADLELIYNICKHIEPKVIIETGVAYGWSSSVILNYIKKNSSEAKLISFDMPYPLCKNTSYVGSIVCEKFKTNWTLIKKIDLLAIKKILLKVKSIDFFHYDSDKSYEGMFRMFKIIYPYLKPNGFLIIDDINDNMAFHDFTEMYSLNSYIIKLNNKFIGIIKK